MDAYCNLVDGGCCLMICQPAVHKFGAQRALRWHRVDPVGCNATGTVAAACKATAVTSYMD